MSDTAGASGTGREHDPAGPLTVEREVLLYGWVDFESPRSSRPQDTSDAIVIRTEGDAPTVQQHVRLGALEAALVVGGAVDVEPMPAARQWRGLVLGYLVDGSLSVSQGQNSVELGPGDFAFYTGAQRYRITSSGQHTYLVVRIPTASIALRHGAFMEVIASDLSGTPSSHALRGILGALAAPDARPSVAASAHLGDALLAAAHAVIADARPPGTAKAMSLFTSLVLWIEKHLVDPDLSAEQVAEAHFLSPRYVRRVFATNGTTVSALIRQRRLERIRDDLVDPRQIRVPIHTLAERWSMPDPTAFSRAFSRQFGMSPRRYRTMHLHQGQDGVDDWTPPATPAQKKESDEPST